MEKTVLEVEPGAATDQQAQPHPSPPPSGGKGDGRKSLLGDAEKLKELRYVRPPTSSYQSCGTSKMLEGTLLGSSTPRNTEHIQGRATSQAARQIGGGATESERRHAPL